jgi:hypothetical protein
MVRRDRGRSPVVALVFMADSDTDQPSGFWHPARAIKTPPPTGPAPTRQAVRPRPGKGPGLEEVLSPGPPRPAKPVETPRSTDVQDVSEPTMLPEGA